MKTGVVFVPFMTDKGPRFAFADARTPEWFIECLDKKQIFASWEEFEREARAYNKFFLGYERPAQLLFLQIDLEACRSAFPEEWPPPGAPVRAAKRAKR